DALRRKLPGAATSLAWQYVFPASRPCTDSATGRLVLYHLHESAVQKAVTAAARAAGIHKRTSTHTLRHSFATALLEARMRHRRPAGRGGAARVLPPPLPSPSPLGTSSRQPCARPPPRPPVPDQPPGTSRSSTLATTDGGGAPMGFGCAPRRSSSRSRRTAQA